MVTKQVKVSFLSIDLKTEVQRVPILWMSFKNYYGVNGKNPTAVHWMEPILCFDDLTYEDILRYYEEQDADVYAFSCYLWNHIATVRLAEDLKKSNPKRVIILGGPHLNITHNKIDWFFKHKFVDAICEPTSYGEMFMTDMLDQLTSNGEINWKEVSFSIYRTGRGKFPNKREFKFPGGIIKGNEDIVYKCKEIAQSKNVVLALPIEMTRGCPYECVFCEWGGGIGGKVVRKPFDMIIEDLEQIPVFGIDRVQILDANVGIYDEDEQVTLYLENMKTVFNLPSHVEIYGMTKSSAEKKRKTFEPLARAGICDRYKISLQSLDDEVLSNIKRKNIPVEDDLEYARHLLKQHGVRSDLEFIMGLPGHTRELFYDEVDIQYEHGYTLERYMWMLLPDSPAYNPEYKDKFNIKTTKISVSKSRTLDDVTFDDVVRSEKYHITEDPRYKSDVEIVVEANGYTRDEYVEFMFMNHWVIQNWIKVRGHDNSHHDFFFNLPDIIQYNLEQGNIDKPSTFFKEVYNCITTLDNEYSAAMRELIAQMSDIVYGRVKEITEFKYYKLPFTQDVVEITYLLRTCNYVFIESYIDTIKHIAKKVGMVIPEKIIQDHLINIDFMDISASPKYDYGYKILQKYNKVINERRKQTNEDSQ